MGLPDLVKSLIAGPVTGITGGFRAQVGHTKMTGRGTYGPTYEASPTNRLALVEMTSENVAGQDGVTKLSTSKYTFYEQIDIKEGDRLTVNGVTTTVIKVGGLLDPQGKPYLPEAWTGK